MDTAKEILELERTIAFFDAHCSALEEENRRLEEENKVLSSALQETRLGWMRASDEISKLESIIDDFLSVGHNASSLIAYKAEKQK